MLPIEQFKMHVEGTDQYGEHRKVLHHWSTADKKKKITFIQLILVFKVVYWMQTAFRSRGIHYDLIVMPAESSFSTGAA